MFSSYNLLKQKTPEHGINRKEFIEHLVEEYYTSADIEAQEQVTANLANFSYDPINWDYLKGAEVLTLFLELLKTNNEYLQTHGSAGLCNICLDQQAFNLIVKSVNFNVIKETFTNSKNIDVLLNLLTLFYQLISQKTSIKTDILCPSILKQIKNCNSLYNNDKRILNITNILLDDFGKRYEYNETTKNSISNSTLLE